LYTALKLGWTMTDGLTKITMPKLQSAKRLTILFFKFQVTQNHLSELLFCPKITRMSCYYRTSI